MRALIGDLAYQAAKRWGEREAFAFPGDRTLSFADIDRLSGRFAGGLSERGVGVGDRVVLHLPNSWQWIVAYHAIARLGAVVVPANILLSPAEVAFITADAQARAIIVPSGRIEALPTSGLLTIVDDGVGDGAVLAFDALLEGTWIAPAETPPDALFTIGYTSGTTGRPKGAMLTQANIFECVAQTATIHVRHSGDRIYSALPFPHVYGNVVMNSAFLTGAWLYAPRRFDAAEALRAIEAERITLFEGVPTMYYQMLGAAELSTADLSSLSRCTVGGQTMPVAKLEAVVERFGCPLLELWGMTEVSGPAVTHSPYWAPRLGSIGLPFPGMEARLADLEDPACDALPGEAGELLVRGPLVTKGYWQNETATREAIDAEGWLATGDIARRSEDGYLLIVDRKKDMILTAGYNVYPAELEQVIAAHPAVAMVAVVGAPNEEKGEIAVAFVVCHRDAALSESELIVHCREHLAAYKVPREVRFVEDLPKTSTGKILRRALGKESPSPSPSV